MLTPHDGFKTTNSEWISQSADTTLLEGLAYGSYLPFLWDVWFIINVLLNLKSTVQQDSRPRPPFLSLNPFTLHTRPGLMSLVSGQLQTGSRTRVTSGSRRNPSADAPSRSCLLLGNPTRLNLYLLTIQPRLGLAYRKIFFNGSFFLILSLYGTD